MVTVGAFAALVIIYIHRRKFNVGIDKETISSISPTRYTSSQLKKFTDGFSTKIGEKALAVCTKGQFIEVVWNYL